MKPKNKYIPAILLAISLLIFWEIYAASGLISKRILPRPSSVFEAIYNFREVILSHTAQTALEVVLGFGLAIIFAVAIAILIFLFVRIRTAIYPLLVVSQTIPVIALAPLFIIWFGFGLVPKVLFVALFCFFPIVVSLLDGLLNTPNHYVDLLKSMGASRWQILRHVNLPFARDRFFTGLKISATYSVTVAIVAEYVGAFKGLGIYMQTAASSHAITQVFAAIFVVIAMTLLLLLFILYLQKISMPWKYHD